jgi:hypothetical protein
MLCATTIDSGSAYTYASNTIRQWRGPSGGNNQVNFLVGVAEDAITVQAGYSVQSALVAGAAGNIRAALDATNAQNLQGSLLRFVAPNANGITIFGTAPQNLNPQMGWHFVAGIENSDGTNANSFCISTNANFITAMLPG